MNVGDRDQPRSFLFPAICSYIRFWSAIYFRENRKGAIVMGQTGVTIQCGNETDADRLKQLLEVHNDAVSYPPFSVSRQKNRLRVECGWPHSADDALPEAWIGTLSRTIADYFVAEKERELLESILRREYGTYDAQERAEIIQYCHSSAVEAGQTPMSPQVRADKICKAVRNVLAEYDFLHLEGLARFRLSEYVEVLRDLVEYAVDEYVMERQYQEFIELLKYFVRMQEIKTGTVHLLHLGDREFVLLDEQLRPLGTDELRRYTETEPLDQELKHEDMIVSTLITASPQSIRIHTRDCDSQIVRTIRQIFDDRSELCSQCTVCRSVLDSSRPREPVNDVSKLH